MNGQCVIIDVRLVFLNNAFKEERNPFKVQSFSNAQILWKLETNISSPFTKACRQVNHEVFVNTLSKYTFYIKTVKMKMSYWYLIYKSADKSV